MAEELMVARDIELARYTDSSIHFTGISTAKSLEHIRKAKKEGLKITCSVTPAHLYFCDEDITGYDSLFKVDPPLRTREDRNALRNAVQDGLIDCIASHHMPHESDSKILEFEYARAGMISLETVFGVLGIAIQGLEPEKIVDLLAVSPRKIFGLEPATIAPGNNASLTLFDPSKQWKLTSTDIRSRSRNTPLTEKNLKGKPIGIINKGSIMLS
jgi:dihydroorotase